MRDRRKSDATTLELGSPNGPLPSPAGALLPERLACPSANSGAVLGRRRALALIRQVGLHDLVKGAFVNDAIEKPVREGPGSTFLAVSLEIRGFVHASLLDQNVAVSGPGNSTLQEEQVALRIHSDDLDVSDRLSNIPGLTGELLALDHPGRIRTGTH